MNYLRVVCWSALFCILSICVSIHTGIIAVAQQQADYAGWKHSGSLFLNTTSEGANLPSEALVENFPVLIRLNGDFFDFSSAQPNGEDVRFSSAGIKLAYQIEEWDREGQQASLWVRIPKIVGNTVQEISVHWGNPTAASESDGNAVFNASNGYLTVLHMAEKLVDETGNVTPEDHRTELTLGRVGKGRHFGGGQGINCGEKIESLPTDANPHSTEAWIRPEKPNGRAMAWGNEHGQGKVVMHFMSPPHVEMECYFSGANVSSLGRMPMNEWTHVLHTYEKGNSRIYINGELSNTSETPNAPLAIRSPARLYIGGWYSNYDFVGDIDEVRISNRVRSADWVKLQFENQKPMQTLVGPVVTPGNRFEISATKVQVAEGGQANVSLSSLGAQKIYWILNRSSSEATDSRSAGNEEVVAVDRSSYTLDAKRVTGDTSARLQCKAIFSDGVRTKEILVSIEERIPDPEFRLEAPTSWDGRESIEIRPVLLNADALRNANAPRDGDEPRIETRWLVEPFAVIKEVAGETLILKRSQRSGKLRVTAVMTNGGRHVSQSVELDVLEPNDDAWVHRMVSADEKPQQGQFYARDDRNLGTLHYNGKLDLDRRSAAKEVYLKLLADGQLVETKKVAVGQDLSYALAVDLKPGLIKYQIEFGILDGPVLDRVDDIVCGDAYIIDGQSNALATDTSEMSPSETSTWIRSYASPSLNSKENEGNLWVLPVWKAREGQRAELGWWGMELAKRLVQSQRMPIFMINAAVGGTRIDQHQRNMQDPTDLSTIYGRMLWRVEGAKLTHGIRAILWHQGENDQGADGPTGGFGWETYHPYFVEMAAGWKQDFPNVSRYYVFQIWPNSCAMGGRSGSGDMLREKQRTLPYLFSNMKILSTLGVEPPGGCHFPLEGWGKFAQMVQPLIEQDFYGKAPTGIWTAPNLVRVSLDESRTKIELIFDQPVKWDDRLVGEFYLDGVKGKVNSGSVEGNALKLMLSESTTATRITYLKEIDWKQDRLLFGENGVAALSFCNVLLENSIERK